MNNKNKIKQKPKQKAANGLQKVTVPAAGSDGQVLSSAVSMGSAGAQFGPYGAAAGAVVGGAMGLMQKGEMDRMNREAVEKNKFISNSLLYNGTDESEFQNTQQFAEGTHATANSKPIEVEKDELIFKKVGNKFKLKADFAGGKSHAKGGEPYTAQEGDVIFPGKQRKQVLSHLKNNNHSALEGMRMKLPKDTNKGEAASGLDLFSRKPSTGTVGLSEDDSLMGFSASNTPSSYTEFQDPNAIVAPLVKNGLPSVNLDAGSALQYASVANNLYQGLQTPERVEENYINPQLLKYSDRSEPQRRASRMALTSQKSAARNAGGGNAQVIRATQSAAQVGNVNRLMDIDNAEQQRADGITAQNAQLTNQAAQVNSQKRDSYADMNARNRAATESYRDAAMGQLASLGNVKEQQKYQKSRDVALDNQQLEARKYINMQTQFMDEDGKIVYNPNAQVRPRGKGKTVTTTEDSKGKKTTRSTIKTK